MKLLDFILSTKAMALLLLLMASSVGVATFIENSYDTITAKVLIYNAKWFELILFLLLINFVNNIKTYKLLQWKKWSILLLHIGFIIALIGAFITRYVGFEGVMLIQENTSSQQIYSSDPWLQVAVHNEKKQMEVTKQHYFSEINTTFPSVEFDFPNVGQVEVNVINRIKNAELEFQTDVAGGKLFLHLILPGRENLYLEDGQVAEKMGIPFALNNNDRLDAVRFYYQNDTLQVFAPFEMQKLDMASLTVADRQKGMDQLPQDTLSPSNLHQVSTRNLLSLLGQQIMINSVEKRAKLVWNSSENEELPDAHLIEVKTNGTKSTDYVLGKAALRPIPTMVSCGGLFFSIGYGSRELDVPFSVKLDDFRLLKYPGSESPSSYESDITINDPKNEFSSSYNIFMNNVVDYGGYRFFQSSYDWSDDQAKSAGVDPDITILSVNHDFWGTWITYVGYLLLAIGLLGTLFNPSSRFVDIRRKVIKMRNKRQAVIVSLIFFMFFGQTAWANDSITYEPIPQIQADSLGILLTQTFEGRIQPTHTLAYDVIHKISKKNEIITNDGITLTPMQVFIDFMVNKNYWINQNIIYVKKGTGVGDSLGIEGKYASVADFFNEDGSEKLGAQLQISFAKKDVEKNVFDKELIKANERMNIALQSMNGLMLKIFPIADDPNNSWVNWKDEYAQLPIDSNDQHLSTISLSRIFKSYIIELSEAKVSDNYVTAQELLNFIKSYQIKIAPKEILMSMNEIQSEINYNESNLFILVKNVYGLLSIALLIFSFWQALISDKNKLVYQLVNPLLWVSIAALAVVFCIHTYALGLRWQITGHAPWSNGYEALTFISWGAVFAGFLFIRSSKITLAGTSLLAFFILMTAGHSSFDPQLTNLQPVLKSYWLMIHVACITISYGFLGLGFILGLINIFNYLFLKSNNKNLKDIISELTYVNEMTLTIGLALATIGTFLGGIWANESWGRYWGWDAKETWALVIVLTYAVVLHFRLIPGLKGKFTFNVASILAFSSVLMTFIGVNYYLSKGLHSYARGETPAFPIWAWITIFSLIIIIVLAWLNKRKLKKVSSS